MIGCFITIFVLWTFGDIIKGNPNGIDYDNTFVCTVATYLMSLQRFDVKA